MQYILCLLILLVSAAVRSQEATSTIDASGAVSADDGEAPVTVTIRLEHSLTGDDKFSPRSTITLTYGSDAKLRVSEVAEFVLSTDDRERFLGLLKTNALYRMRMLSRADNTSSPHIVSAIPACQLQKSGFKEELTLHLDLSDGIIAANYFSRIHSAIARPCDPNRVPATLKMTPRVRIADPTVAQSVPVIAMGHVPPTLQVRLVLTQHSYLLLFCFVFDCFCFVWCC